MLLVSIPCGTIKRITLQLFNCKSFEVSIPCGTIKSNTVISETLILAKFQFLVVQLRGFSEKSFILTKKVSIPCGTIKSTIGLSKLWRFLAVSIPCGTIKR